MRYVRVALLIGLIAVGVVSGVVGEEIVNEYLRGTVEESFYDPSPRPGFEGGTFAFRAKFVNTSDLKLASLAFRVLELSGGNQLISVDEGESGLLASRFTLPHERRSGYEDGILGPSEQVPAWFFVALKTTQKFQFYVDAVGVAASTPYVAFLEEGVEFQSVVDSFPGNTTFIVRKGKEEHRKQSVIPNEGNVFIGEDGAVINGSSLLSKEGGTWVNEGDGCWSIAHVPVSGNYVHPDPQFCEREEGEDGGLVCLRANNGKFLTAAKGQETTTIGAESDQCVDNFTRMEVIGYGTRLKSGAIIEIRSDGGFWSAQPSGELEADRLEPGKWEKFTIYKLGSDGSVIEAAKWLDERDIVGLKGAHGTWARVASDSRIWVDAETVGGVLGSDARFIFETVLKATCKFPEDLYRDDSLVEQVEFHDELEQLKSDCWWLDYVNGKIKVCLGDGNNPANHTMEVSYARFAFGGGDHGTIDKPTKQANPDVVIRDLTVEKYAVPIQFGAVGYQRAGDKWRIENNEVKQNHGSGIAFAKNSRVIGNYVHDNGEIGIKSALTQSNPLIESVVTQNVIADNGRPDFGYNIDWEGGGTKFSHTKSLLVDRNWVTNNSGPGLWSDIDNCDIKYLCNVVEDNRDEGIYHEISYSASIVDNVVRRNGNNIDRVFSNGMASDEPIWASQIFISASSDAEVTRNFVETDDVVGNGITLLQTGRGSGKDYCTGEVSKQYCPRSNRIFGNRILHHKRQDESKNNDAGISGGYLSWSDDTCDQDSFWTMNIFDGNAFYTPEGGSEAERYWYWNNSKLSFTAFVEAFNDETSTIDTIDSIAIDDDLTVIPDPGCFNTIGELGVPLDFEICLVTHDQLNFVTTGSDGVVLGTSSRCDAGGSVRIYDMNGGELVDGDILYIQAPSSQYWAADKAGNLKALSQGVGTDEQFKIHKVRGTGGAGSVISDYDQVGLLSVPYRKWVVAENGGGSILHANRPDRAEWETFTFITKR